MAEAADGRPLFRDIRRYYCDFCGICRSKKSLIASHILAVHKEELESTMAESDSDTEESRKSNTCEQCGATFKKPAHLKQHMQSHAVERPYTCPADDCAASYRRKDHLNRHLLSHKRNLFNCPMENCNVKFVSQSNIYRHVKDKHDENRESTSKCHEKCVCQEAGCGKAFIYPSRLQKHEESHVKLDSVEALCAVPGCMKMFSNAQCLKEHNQTCHQHITCDICGTRQIKRNIKRHMRTHEEGGQSEQQIECTYKNCDCSFSTKSNLNKHVKAVHCRDKPFVCGIPGCGMRFSYKHVRDNHEKNGAHVYAHGDFVEADEQFRSRPRGGRKRNYPTVEKLIRKRVTPPNILDDSFNYFSSSETSYSS